MAIKAEQFLQLIDNGQAPNEGQVKQLDQILEEYPYFQAVRAIQLKWYYRHHDFSYYAALKKTASHTTDRSVLFDFITDEKFEQDHISARIKKRKKDSSEKQTDFRHAVTMKKSEADRVLDPGLFKKTTTPFSVPKKNDDRAKSAITGHSDREKEGYKGGGQKRSFTDWLKMTTDKSKIKSTDPAKAEQPSQTRSKSREHEIIDKFIENNPKIKPGSTPPKPEVPFRQYSADSDLMTETLARIYANQKKYDKAIQAYNILILKNPEKSGLFADRIREIENKQENKSQ